MAKVPVHSQQGKNPSGSSSEEADPGGVAVDLSEGEREGMRALGISNPVPMPSERTGIPDLLMYALVPYSGVRPDQGIVLGVAAELDALAMFIEGPLSVTVEMLARRLRVAVDLARQLSKPPTEAG